MEHLWRDNGWYHEVTKKPFDQEVYIAGVRRRQAECERRRYWDHTSGTRQRRLQRSMRDAGDKRRNRRAAMQLTLESVLPLAAGPRRNLSVASDAQQTASVSDDPTTCRGNERLAALHCHAQDPVAKLGR